MGPIAAVRTCLAKYATFSGRASRPEYWWFFLAYFVLYLVAAVLDVAFETLFVIQPIVVVLLLLPMLAAAVRRLHDTGRSGWWYFVALIPLIGGIWLLVLLTRDSTPGPNAYGATPA